MTSTGRIIEIDVETIASNGDGLGERHGLQVSVPFTIPGERVRIRLGPSRQGRAVGELVEIIRPSAWRVTPRCPHFGPDVRPGPCGGCHWQHIAYPEQLRLKSALVTTLVAAALPGTHVEVRPTLPATAVESPWGYRHKAHFVFGSGARNGSLVMGHYMRGSRRVLPINECPVHDPRANAWAFGFRDELNTSGVLAAGNPGRGTLRHVVVRAAARTKELMATLVVTTDRDKRLRAATQRDLDASGLLTAFHVNVHARMDAYLFGAETRRILGPARIRDEVAGISFLISPTSFFQTNALAADLLVNLVLNAIPTTATVLDLYAGGGLFALPLAKRGQRVLAIEASRSAVADGAAGRDLNKIDPERCRFVTADVGVALRKVRPADARAVVFDPPREGCGPDVLKELFGRLHPDVAVYVSCNPETLARDLEVIHRLGYAPDSLQPVDMFPHTPHIETVVVLRKT